MRQRGKATDFKCIYWPFHPQDKHNIIRVASLLHKSKKKQRLSSDWFLPAILNTDIFCKYGNVFEEILLFVFSA